MSGRLEVTRDELFLLIISFGHISLWLFSMPQVGLPHHSYHSRGQFKLQVPPKMVTLRMNTSLVFKHALKEILCAKAAYKNYDLGL
jgi:hypothetical protein